nr:VOC family protein [Parvularcula dongshanensis]
MLGSATAQTPERPAITGVSHLAVYAADPDASERFYVETLGATRRADPTDPDGVRYYFSPKQFVEVLPLPAEAGEKNRLAHAAFATEDAEALRAYLEANDVKVPDGVEKASDGSAWFEVEDPEGTPVRFVEAPETLPDVRDNPISSRVMHVGFIVHDRARQDAFYKDVLGFRDYWSGGPEGEREVWVSLQVPDGTDWVEYMIVGEPDGHGIPEDMSKDTLGVLNHFALGVPNTRDTYTVLWNEERLAGQDEVPKIGLDAKWQLNLYDPDGTRAEFMEFAPIGEPCCNPFKGAHPSADE